VPIINRVPTLYYQAQAYVGSAGTVNAVASLSAASGGYGSSGSEKAVGDGSSPGYGAPSPGYGQ